MSELDKDTKDHFHRQLIKLGDMMGDGLHHEPDGKWIEKEYKQILKALGILPKRKTNNDAINDAMKRRVRDVPCPRCQGQLVQTRSGAKRAQCQQYQSKFQLLK